MTGHYNIDATHLHLLGIKITLAITKFLAYDRNLAIARAFVKKIVKCSNQLDQIENLITLE